MSIFDDSTTWLVQPVSVPLLSFEEEWIPDVYEYASYYNDGDDVSDLDADVDLDVDDVSEVSCENLPAMPGGRRFEDVLQEFLSDEDCHWPLCVPAEDLYRIAKSCACWRVSEPDPAISLADAYFDFLSWEKESFILSQGSAYPADDDEEQLRLWAAIQHCMRHLHSQYAVEPCASCGDYHRFERPIWNEGFYADDLASIRSSLEQYKRYWASVEPAAE